MTTRNGRQTAGRAHQHPTLTKIAAATGASSSRSKPAAPPDVAPELAAVQLVDGKTAATAGFMSLSWWNERVAEGVAPQPVFRATRCTRWRLADVVAFWRDFRPDDIASAACLKQAVAASAKAAEQRRAAASAPEAR